MRTWVLCILSFATLMPASWSQTTQKLADDKADVQSSQPIAGDYHFKIEPDRAAGEANLYCAYMRTYRVKRQDGSDAVRLAGYTECVPTQRFEVKRALQILDEDSPRK